MRGNLIVDRQDGTTSNLGQSTIVAGNTIPQGTVNNSQGRIFLCAANDKYSTIQTLQNLSVNNIVYVPDKSGTIALTSDTSDKFGIVEITVPADTEGHAYNLPTGFRSGSCILLGALCYTKYKSYVDKDYSHGDYFGDINFLSGDRFNYTAYKAGNSTSIKFLFYSIL